jgi:LemA protein
MVRALLIIVLVLAVLAMIGFVVGYNKIRSADVRVAEALGGIDVELTRRTSLIPSLVHTVQTFAVHEKGILDHVTDARASLTSRWRRCWRSARTIRSSTRRTTS